MNRLSVLLRRYLPLFLMVGALLGIGAPSAAFALRRITPVCLAVLVFFPALRMNRRNFTSAFSLQIRILAASALMMFGLTPLLMYALGRMVRLDNAVLVGLVLGSAAPSMLSAPYFTGLMKGNIGVAFSISVLSTALSPLLVPLTLLLMFGRSTAVDATAVAEVILLVIAIPVVLAVLIGRISSTLAASLRAAEDLFTVGAIVLINWVMIGTNRNTVVGSASSVVLPLLVLGLVQDFGVFFLTRKVASHFVPDDISKSLAVSFGLKNVALVGGVLLVFSESFALASGVVSLVHVCMFVMIGLRKDKL